MSFEQPKKVTIAEDDKKEFMQDEIAEIEKILIALENNDPNYAYADTSDLMDILDSMLHENVAYQNTLAARKEASRNIIQGDAEKKRQGIEQLKAWVKTVKELI